jgi:hypothetical protein
MIGELDFRDLSFSIMFVFLYFIVPWALIEATYNDKFRIDLKPLWIYKNKLDKFAVIIIIAFWAHTSYMILSTLIQKVTTADWLAYAGVWVAPILVKMVGAAFGSGGNGKEPPSISQPQPGASP